MNLWRSIKDIGTSITAMPELINPISWTKSALYFSARTLGYAFEQIGALPGVVTRILSHPPTRRLARHTAYIALHDVAPQVLLIYSMNALRIGANSYLLDDETKDSIRNQSISAALFLIQTAVTLYGYRRATRRVARQAVLMIEASPSLNKDKALLDGICDKEKCSVLRQMQGAVRDNAAFWATEFAISGSAYIPVAGPYLAPLLRISHLGRYIVGASMPEVCNRHQAVYLQNNPELSWSFGLMHASLSYLCQAMMHPITGESSEIKALIELNLIFLLSAIAIQMPLPAAKSNSERISIDPINAFQRSVGIGVDITLLGLKKYIPRMLSQPGKAFDFAALEQFFQDHRSDKLFIWTQYLLLDKTLHSLENFRKDPLVEEHWEGLRNTSRSILSGIESQEGRWLVKATGFAPKFSAKAADIFLGYPKSVVKLLIKLLNSPYFIQKVRDINSALSHASDLPPVQAGDSTVLGRKVPSPQTEKRSTAIIPPQALKEKSSPNSQSRILAQLQAIKNPSQNASLLQQLQNIKNPRSNLNLFPPKAAINDDNKESSLSMAL